MKDPNNPCIFCKIRKEELQFENELAYSSIDSYPVSKFHILIVPKRHIQDYFDLSAEEVQKKDPKKIIEKAVKGMLPKNKLGSAIYKNLKVFIGENHDHEAQKPKKIDLKELI